MKNVAHLFAPLHQELVQVLRGLDAKAWDQTTVAGTWRVRDVAAHLLDGDLRKLAMHRDGHLYSPMATRPESYSDVVALINSLNASGVEFAARLSTRLLTDLLEVTGRWVSEFVESLDPGMPALFPVAWAGEAESQNWMDTGREYTERWHHQMQIRDAAGLPLLLDDFWYEPLLSFSVRALPRVYAEVAAPSGTALTLRIADSELAWSIVRNADGWSLSEGAMTGAAAEVSVSRNDAWRLFYNAYSRDAAASALHVEGDEALAQHIVSARSVMV